MPTTFTITLSDRLTKAAERLGSLQQKTAADYVDTVLKHVLRGEAERIAAEDAQRVLTAFDSAGNDIQREVERVLGLR